MDEYETLRRTGIMTPKSELLDRIQGEIHEKLAQLRPLYEEYQRLLAASEALDDLEGPIGLDEAQKPFTPDPERAPYGYKSDGVTPRKRPGPLKRDDSDPEAPWGRKKDGTPRKQPGRRKGQIRPDADPPQEIRLRVISSTTPTEDELKDREVAHVTAEPA